MNNAAFEIAFWTLLTLYFLKLTGVLK